MKKLIAGIAEALSLIIDADKTITDKTLLAMGFYVEAPRAA